MVATASDDKAARIWSVPGGTPISPPLEHLEGSGLVEFSADGRLLLTASGDNSVRLWTVPTGKLVRTIPQNGSVSAAMHPNGRLAVIGEAEGAKGRCQLWDVRTGLPVGPPISLEWGAAGLFNPDGSKVLYHSMDFVAYLAPVPNPVQEDAALLTEWVEALTGTYLGPDGIVQPLDAASIAERRQLVTAISGGRLRVGQPTGSMRSRDEQLAWHQQRAREREGTGYWHAALFYLDRLMELDPDNLDYFHRRAEALAATGQVAAAIADVSKAIELNQNSWQLYARRGVLRSNSGQFEAAVTDLSKAIELNADSPRLMSYRAVAHARDEHWNEAADDFAAAIRLGMRDLNTQHMYAVVLLASGQNKKYQKHCAKLLSEDGHTSDAQSMNALAWTCVLAADAVDDFKPIVQMAEKAVVAMGNRHDVLKTLGTALYRAGRFQEAIDRLQAGIAAHERKTGGPHDWLVLAMAHHRLGHAVEARQWLHKAARELDKAAHSLDSDTKTAPATEQTARPWTDRLELDLFRREAESMLGQKNQ